MKIKTVFQSFKNVVDVLQLARLCNAPDLHVKCMKLVADQFKAVEKTEAWKFLQKYDPWLELEILQFMDEAELRKKRRRRQKEEQSVYLELNEAMECLAHIWTEGCTNVGPCDMDVIKRRKPCSRFSTCHGIQALIEHFASCNKRVDGRCCRCKPMWQLLRLHALMCDQPELCKVPLCRRFKLRMQQEKRGDDAKWRLLARKVMSAKAMSSLSLAKEKRS
ncbi:BTB/POZ and TAZ domain-containing protein 1 [Dionaea muscipula]